MSLSNIRDCFIAKFQTRLACDKASWGLAFTTSSNNQLLRLLHKLVQARLTTNSNNITLPPQCMDLKRTATPSGSCCSDTTEQTRLSRMYIWCPSKDILCLFPNASHLKLLFPDLRSPNISRLHSTNVAGRSAVRPALRPPLVMKASSS